ncbi:MAG: hypothetical protein M0Q41_09370 [Bacteroidales bacterium]|nr:hypothetical protein [Bacteroidales bacterium]
MDKGKIKRRPSIILSKKQAIDKTAHCLEDSQDASYAKNGSTLLSMVQVMASFMITGCL